LRANSVNGSLYNFLFFYFVFRFLLSLVWITSLKNKSNNEEKFLIGISWSRQTKCGLTSTTKNDVKNNKKNHQNDFISFILYFINQANSILNSDATLCLTSFWCFDVAPPLMRRLEAFFQPEAICGRTPA
jgi:hypothetical protein